MSLNVGIWKFVEDASSGRQRRLYEFLKYPRNSIWSRASEPLLGTARSEGGARTEAKGRRAWSKRGSQFLGRARVALETEKREDERARVSKNSYTFPRKLYVAEKNKNYYALFVLLLHINIINSMKWLLSIIGLENGKFKYVYYYEYNSNNGMWIHWSKCIIYKMSFKRVPCVREEHTNKNVSNLLKRHIQYRGECKCRYGDLLTSGPSNCFVEPSYFSLNGRSRGAQPLST